MRAHSKRGHVGLLVLLVGAGMALVAQAASPSQPDMLKGNYDIVIKDCREQIERQQFDACIAALNTLSNRISDGATEAEADIKVRVGYYTSVVEAYKAAGQLDPERPSDYYNTIFSAMAGIPEKYFPYEDARPLWDRYLREDTGRARFKRYRGLRVTIRASEEKDKPLEEELFRTMQPLLLGFGYSILDPASSLSTNPDSYLKIAVKGALVEDTTDPRLQYQKVYRLTMDIQSFKFLTARTRVDPLEVEIEQAATTEQIARGQAIQRGAERLTQLLFYHSLKNMFTAT